MASATSHIYTRQWMMQQLATLACAVSAGEPNDLQVYLTKAGSSWLDREDVLVRSLLRGEISGDVRRPLPPSADRASRPRLGAPSTVASCATQWVASTEGGGSPTTRASGARFRSVRVPWWRQSEATST